MQKRAWVSLLFLAALLGACESIPFLKGDPDKFTVAEKDFVESRTPLGDTDLESLWERARQVVAGEGLAVDESRTRYADRLLVTRWNTNLSPVRYEGRRSRVWIRFVKAPSGWVAGAAVQVQRNADIKNPSDPQLSEWESQPADANRGGVILWKIESGFRVGDSETK